MGKFYITSSAYLLMDLHAPNLVVFVEQTILSIISSKIVDDRIIAEAKNKQNIAC